MARTSSLIAKGSPLILLGLIAGCVQILEIDVLTPATPDASVPDGGAMAPVDASGTDAALYDAIPPDASPSFSYEIAYVSDMIFDPGAGALDIAGFLVLINTGTGALDLSTTRVQSFYDDSAQVGYTFSLGIDTATVLQPGEAAGELSPLATQRIIGAGLVPEPLVDTTYGFAMLLNNLPPEKLDVNAQAVINIGGKNITVPFTIHLVPGADTEFSATRIRLAD